MAGYKREMRDGIERRTYPSGKVSFFVPLPLGKKQRWHKIDDPQTWAHARREKRRLLSEIERGSYVEAARQQMPLEAFCARWFAGRQHDLRPNSLRLYSRAIDTQITPHLGSIPLSQLSPEDVERWKAGQLRSGLSPATVRGALNLLRQILARAVDWQYLHRNVATMVAPPTIPAKELVVWDDQHIQRFLAVLPREWAALYKVPLLTGLRLGEVQGMRWRYLDADAQTYTVREQYSSLTKTLSPPKTAESIASVYVPPSLLDDLQAHRRAQREARQRNIFWADGIDLVWPSPQKLQPISTSAVRAVLSDGIKAAGVPPLTYHGLRHTFVSQLVRQGENLKVVQRKARHKNVQITLDKYSHLFPDDSEMAGARLDERLFG